MGEKNFVLGDVRWLVRLHLVPDPFPSGDRYWEAPCFFCNLLLPRAISASVALLDFGDLKFRRGATFASCLEDGFLLVGCSLLPRDPLVCSYVFFDSLLSYLIPKRITKNFL